MDEDLILETKKPTGQVILYGCIGAALVCAGCAVIYRGCTMAEYVQLPQILGGSFFLLMAVVFFYSLRSMVSYRLYEDRLEVVSVTGIVGKTIWPISITSWSEYKFKNGRKCLTIFTDNDKYRILDIDLKEYDALRDCVTQGKTQVAATPNRKPLIMLFLFFFVGGLGMWGNVFYSYSIKDRKVAASDIAGVGGIVISPVKITNTGGRGARNLIEIKLVQYPQFTFRIDYAAYAATKRRDYLNYARPMDSVFIDILASDYQKKISKEKPLGFFDKSVNYGTIDVYGLRDKHNSYLTLQDYNNADKLTSDFYLCRFMGPVFLLLSVIIIVVVYKQKPQDV